MSCYISVNVCLFNLFFISFFKVAIVFTLVTVVISIVAHIVVVVIVNVSLTARPFDTV